MKDLQERLSSLEGDSQRIIQEIAEIKKQLEAPEKKERWRADEEGEYFYIDDEMFIHGNYEELSDIDKNRFNTFNYFQTREEAERTARVQLAFRKLDWAIRQFEIVDPSNLDSYKGYELFINEEGKLDWSEGYYRSSPLPKLMLKSDAEYILQNYQPELLTFLTGGEK